MKRLPRKWLLTALLIVGCAPLSLAQWDKSCNHYQQRHCRQEVPEGGSSAAYLLGAGLICGGALFIRARARREA